MSSNQGPFIWHFLEHDTFYFVSVPLPHSSNLIHVPKTTSIFSQEIFALECTIILDNFSDTSLSGGYVRVPQPVSKDVLPGSLESTTVADPRLPWLHSAGRWRKKRDALWIWSGRIGPDQIHNATYCLYVVCCFCPGTKKCKSYSDQTHRNHCPIIA